jgi:hypothetical protein
MVEYVLRFADRDEIRIADQDGHEVGDAIAIGGHDWIVESIRVPEGTVPERIALRLVSPSRDRVAPGGQRSHLAPRNHQAGERSRDGFTIVMTVSEWIDAQVWPASERVAGAEE